MKVLFLCSKNRLRSPTAERLYRKTAGHEVKSAGLDDDAVKVVTEEDITWADLIVVFEKKQRRKLGKLFSNAVAKKIVACLNVPDTYEYMEPTLIKLLMQKLPQLIGRPAGYKSVKGVPD